MKRVAGVRWSAWLGVVVCVLLGSRPAWAEDDDDGGGGGGGGAAAEPDHAPAAAPDEPDAPEPAAGSAAGDDDHDADGSAAGSGDHDADGSAAGSGDHDADGSAAGSGDHDADGSAAGSDDHDADGSAAGSADADAPDAPLTGEDAAVDAELDAELDEEPAEGAIVDADGDGELDPPYYEFDEDGDGVVEPDEAEAQKEFEEAFAGIPDQVDDDALDARPDGAELMPSLDAATFQKLVRLAKKKVMPRLEAKIEKKTAAKMAKFAKIVVFFSLAGLLLLLTPLFLMKKYPGKAGMLFKYAAIAAVTFVVTVNLFGGVLFGMRSVQGALGRFTNPQLAIANGLFDTLDHDAEEYIVLGKELFAPTLEQMHAGGDDPPAMMVIANGQRVVQDAKVFLSIAKLFKKLDVVFGMLPIVLTLVTLLLLVLALKPTLMEIIKLPAAMASGQASGGGDVVKASLRRVYTEFLATMVTLVALVLVTVVSAVMLGQIVEPALKGLLEYFSIAVQYLQFVQGASSGVVFLTLFAVTFFLGLNLAAIILSSAFFLGKVQKVFQHRFTDGAPLATHKKFLIWGPISLVWVQLFPLLFLIVGQKALAALNDKLMDGVTDPSQINWKALLVAGPLLLVVGFIVLFWAARGMKALGFLFGYKVKPKPPKAPKGGAAPSAAA